MRIVFPTCGSALRRAQYTRRKFRMIYTKVMKKSPHVQRNSSSFIRYVGNQNATLSLLAETLPSSPDMPYFDHPFNELLVSTLCFDVRVSCLTAVVYRLRCSTGSAETRNYLELMTHLCAPCPCPSCRRGPC